MKHCLIFLLVMLSACDSNHTANIHRLDSLNVVVHKQNIVLDTMLIKARDQNRKLTEMNHWLDSAVPHSQKQSIYLRKYFATYNGKYGRLYELHSDSFRYYLNKAIQVK